MKLMHIQPNQWKQVKDIYLNAFPKAERKPFFMLKNAKKVALFTATEKNNLLGFAAAIPLKNLVMIDYLAVNDWLRGKGTGSFIIQSLCQIYQDKKIMLLIEQLDDSAENRQQRIDRRHFYLKNGFCSSKLLVNDVSGTMEIMNFGGTVSPEEYLDLQKYALGPLLFRLSKQKCFSTHKPQ